MMPAFADFAVRANVRLANAFSFAPAPPATFTVFTWERLVPTNVLPAALTPLADDFRFDFVTFTFAAVPTAVVPIVFMYSAGVTPAIGRLSLFRL